VITADLHIHTHYSHGLNSVEEMHRAGRARNLSIMGFTEHSPRPPAYVYPREYRDRLQKGMARYVREVLELKDGGGTPAVLFGMEVDWFEEDRDFVRQAARAHAFDYLLGSVHFLGRWGFDASAADWEVLSEQERGVRYAAYFATLGEMARSRLFQIAAHPDVIKLFSIESFRSWLGREDSRALVGEALRAMRDAGMAMEVSSAGLRKPCAEIYPGPVVMRLAADIGLPVSFASDAHAADQVGFAFAELARYAASFGYRSSLVFIGEERRELAFCSDSEGH
jgi:histidinol-phosphatase (PHP family)